VARRVSNSDPNSKTSTVAQVFTLDVDPNLQTAQADFKLRPFDIVSVYTLPGYEPQRTVKVEGEVVYPGYYVIQKKNERISDIISRAGGLNASADADGGTLRRDNIAILGINKNKADTAAILREEAARTNRLKKSYRDSTAAADSEQMRNNYVGIDMAQIIAKPGSNTDLIVEDGDIIRIPKQEQIVRVNGEVLYPSAVVYSNGKSFKDYILNAGGYSPNALKKGAYVVYPNGTVRGTGKFLFFNTHPEIKPGSEIYVPKHPPRHPLTAVEVVGLTSGLASIAAVILGIISLNK
jgi:protein involved in polysaccharide export with SLBB domain